MNHFERFGLEPRPWVDQELLKQRFLTISTEAHPDKAAADRKAEAEQEFTAINGSYNILRNTRSRLLHLLQISGEPKQEHVQQVPADALDLFAVVASATKKADALIKQKSAANSPMLKAQFMVKGLEKVDLIQDLQGKIHERIGGIEERLRNLSSTWNEPPDAGTLKVLDEAAAALGFLERWNAQLQERIGALTF